jgi:hypothetical protein
MALPSRVGLAQQYAMGLGVNATLAKNWLDYLTWSGILYHSENRDRDVAIAMEGFIDGWIGNPDKASTTNLFTKDNGKIDQYRSGYQSGKARQEHPEEYPAANKSSFSYGSSHVGYVKHKPKRFSIY